VFFWMGIPAREPYEQLLRTGTVLQWFDVAGVDEVPPLFIGRDGARVHVVPGDGEDAPAGVVVAAVALVPDPDAVVSLLSQDEAGLHDLGVRRMWVYRALDEANEVLIVMQVETTEDAVRWAADRELLGKKLLGAALGVYPPVFAGTLGGVIDPHRTR
jgi:hypothetical protein